MAAKPKEYHKLPGQGIRRQGFFSVGVTRRRMRIWLGQDHLLSVESQWYTEEYRRFYFRDIQAVIIRKTNSGKIINLILAVPALLSLWGLLITSQGFRIFWTIVFIVFTFFLVLNTLFGPTSVCHLQTAVQLEEMPSLRRLRRARKVLARVRPFIAAAQGQLTPEDIAARTGQPAASPALSGTELPGAATAPPAA